MTPGVVVDLGAGRARVGDRVLPVRPAARGPAGALVVGEAVVRPLLFGERLRLVADALAPGSDDARALAAAVLAAACPAGPDPRPGERAAFEALALHLAGARTGGDRTPGFATCAAVMSRAFGWSAEAVVDAEASVVDRLAAAVAGPPLADATHRGDDDGWTRIVLAPAPRASGADDDGVPSERVRDDLARDLLRRGAEPFTEVLPATGAGSTARRGADPGDTVMTAIGPPAGPRSSARGAGAMRDHEMPRRAARESAADEGAAGERTTTVPPDARMHASADHPGSGPESRPTGPLNPPVPPGAAPAPGPALPREPAGPAVTGRPWPEPIATGPAWRPAAPHDPAGPETPAAIRTDASRPSLAGRSAVTTPAWAAAAGTTAAPGVGATSTGAPITPARATPGGATAVGRSAVDHLAIERSAGAHAATRPAAARESATADVAALADHLAALLDDEADLRGIRR